MAIESAFKSKAVLALNGGINAVTGGVITKNVTFNNLLAGADKDDLWAVVSKLIPCLSYPFSRLRRVEETIIEP